MQQNQIISQIALPASVLEQDQDEIQKLLSLLVRPIPQIPTPEPAPPHATKSERAERLLQFASCVLRHSYHILQTTKELAQSGGDARSIAKGIEAADMGLSICSRKMAQAVIVMSRADPVPQDAAPAQAAGPAPAPGGDQQQQQQRQLQVPDDDLDDVETPVLFGALQAEALLQKLVREHAGLRIPDEMRGMLGEIQSMLEEDDDLRDTCSSCKSATTQALAL